MRRPWIALLLCLPGVAVFAAEPVVDPTMGEEQPPIIDPAAIDALNRMGSFLRQQESFEVRSQSATDTVLNDGQKVQILQQADLRVVRPDRMRLDVVSDRKDRHFFYDGDELTVWAPRNQLYATVDAPPTLFELANTTADEYGLEFPLADLFLWGTEQSPVAEIEGAKYIGPSKVGGVQCDQYAFRQPGLDWQVWIQRGDEPLPLRMVLTTLDEKEEPQHEVALAWTLDRKFDEEIFTFVPPEGAHPVPLVPRDQKNQADQRASR